MEPESEMNNMTEFIARPYQAQLEEIAVSKNTIIHLPTGSGKTFIAIRLIKRFREALQKPWGQGGQRTFFLVNTVPLVNQQKQVIQTLCPVNGVGAFSSEDGVDYWDKAKWDLELTKNQVIVMTCQILYDMLQHGYIKVEDINLLIFDECHHAVENHPMREVMKTFDMCHPSKHPRVLGLTATLLNANVKRNSIHPTLKTLETTFHATIATVNELGEVLSYSTNPRELVQYHRPLVLPAAAKEAINRLTELQGLVRQVILPHPAYNREFNLQRGQEDITSDPKKITKAVNNMILSMELLIAEMGVYGGSLGILAYIILLERLKRKASSKEEEILYNFTITHCTEARMILLNSMQNDSGYNKIVKHSSEKILQLLNILKEYNPNIVNKPGVLMAVNHARKALSGIIFVEQRFTAKVLYNILKHVVESNPADFGFLKHDFITGFNISPHKMSREQHYLKKSSQKALLDFAEGELNCIISTSVIEEGVDIRQCSLIIRYDPPKEYRSYIQSKGRARSKESSYVILVELAEQSKFNQKYRDFQATEHDIQRILVGKSDQRDAPTMKDIQENLYDDEDIPPYVTPQGGRLSAVSAISLLHRYCNMLPHDLYTVIAPMWLEKKLFDKRVVTVILPVGCPIKEPIDGLPMRGLKSAKRSAALNACIQLHQDGLLDEKTMLPVKYEAVNFDDQVINGCFPNWRKDDQDPNNKDIPKAGTKKRRRKHNIMFPKSLKRVPGKNIFYLHIIKLKPNFPEPKDSRERELYNFINRSEGFGFLTPSKIPKPCDFPSFLTVGEVITSIEVNYAVINLEGDIFELVKEFHFFIFDQVLAIAKKFVVFDDTDNCVFVVPVSCNTHDGYDIDWDVMQEYNQIRPMEIPSVQERRSLSVTPENYKGCVVTPWYRGTITPDRYVVTNVLEYKTPDSLFDTKSYVSYADYYSSRYNLIIEGNKKQPLLEVRNISTRMNCLLPRAATINSFTDKQKKLVSAAQGDDKPRAYAELFIAEFCIKDDFPGVLWYKAMMLPSILHRLHMILVTHELMSEISVGLGYGAITRNDWLPVKVNFEVAINSLLSQIEESAPIATVDRINNPSTSDGESKPLNISSMKNSLYQLQKNKISSQYPWDEKMEPLDIERNLMTATVMDIECYWEFVTTNMIPETDKTGLRSPKGIVPMSPAIQAPPMIYIDKINILEKQPNSKGPELRDVMAALTTIKSSDNFNLERAETLGDSFLKFAGSLYLYHKFPKLNEGQLTNIKGRLISNRNLYYAGERFNLGGRMKVEQFSARKDFLVPSFFAPKKVREFIAKEKIRPTFLIGVQISEPEALKGKMTAESWNAIVHRYRDNNGAIEAEPEGGAQNAMQCYVKNQAVSDKSVADCVEALIGTYLLSGGITTAVKFLEWMRVFPREDNFLQYLHKRVPTPLSEKKATLEDIDRVMDSCRSDIENILGYKFKDPSYLLEAITHSSYINNRLTRSYERLEFLGDAILDFLITAYMYENCESLKPGEMTDLRSALVNNVTFASYLVKLGLHKFICCDLNPVYDKAILQFVEHQEARNHEILEDVLYRIFEEECRIAEYVEVPKALSDVFEAITGAIYLDCGGDLKTVWKVIYKIMCKEIHSFSKCIPKQPVKVLHEHIFACPEFGEVKIVDPDLPSIMVPVTFTKNGERHTVYGVGQNKFNAKRAAAKLALKVLAL